MSKKKRDIKIIASELQIALKREATDVVAIGGLLLEAKEALDHGKWLRWLEKNFGGSVGGCAKLHERGALRRQIPKFW